jgi:hypothetical protein
LPIDVRPNEDIGFRDYERLERAPRRTIADKEVSIRVPAAGLTVDQLQHNDLTIWPGLLSSCESTAPLSNVYDDHDRAAAQARGTNPVAKAPRSAAARDKEAFGTTADGLPVRSFHSLLDDLATFTRNEVTTRAAPWPDPDRLSQAHPDPAKGLRPPRPQSHPYPVNPPPRNPTSGQINNLQLSNSGSSDYPPCQ